jgi:hypothetical protein
MNKATKILVITLDGRCILFFEEGSKLLYNREESHDLLQRIAKKSIYKLEKLEDGDLRLLDKKIWGSAISINEIYFVICYS